MRTTNTDQVTTNDRQASGNQPDHSTPTGSSPSGVVPPPGSGTVTSIAGDGTLTLTPDPITTTGVIGMPATGTAGQYQRVTTDTQGRVTAGANDVINVKEYGALGDGSTNDTAAINNAIADMTSYSTLYFPAGRYLVTLGSIGFIGGMDGITIMGDGMFASQLYSTATGSPSNFLVIENTCQYVRMFGLGCVGAATVRGSGIGLRLYASNAQISQCYFKGTSDFGIHIAGDGTGTAYSEQVTVTGCLCEDTLGDGIHTDSAKDVVVEGNTLRNAGDDSIAFVANDPAFPPLRFTCVGNHIFDGQFRGIAILEGKDFLVEANDIHTTVSAGIELTRFNSTTAYNERGLIQGNKLYGCATATGPIGVIDLFWCKRLKCSDNVVDTPGFASVSGIAFLDCLHVSITDNQIYNSPAYGIRGYDFGAAHVAASQGPLTIKGNFIDICVDYAVYAVADTGTTIFNLFVNENEAVAVSGANTIVFYNKINGGRVWNNTSFGSAVTAGGTVAAVTAGNNN